MYIKAMYVTAGAILALMAHTNIHSYADEQPFDFSLRGSVKRTDISLHQELANASDWGLRRGGYATLAPSWGLRSGRRATLGSSLLLNSGPRIEKANLHNFLQESLGRSFALRSSIHTANASHHAARAAMFKLLPTISLSLETRHEASRNTITNFNSVAEVNEARINAEWTIFSSGANWGAINSARWTALSSDLQFLAAERQVFLEHVTVYLELAARRRLVKEIQSTKRRLQKIKYGVEKQYSVGLTSLTDIAQVDAEIAAVLVELEAARQAYDQQKAIYQDIVGRSAPQNLAIPNVAHLIPSSKAAAVSRALRGNYSIQASYAAAHSASANATAVRGRYLPQVSLFASNTMTQGSSIQSSARDGDNDWSVGARLTVPLVDFSSMASYKQAKQEAYAARYRSHDVKQMVGRDVETSWIEYQSLKRQRAALMRQSKAVKRSLIGLRKELEIGLRPASDILREEIELTNVSVAIINTDMRIAATAFRIAAQFSDLSLSQITPI